MKKSVFFFAVITLTTLNCFSQSREVPFTLDDRDRAIRIEEKLNSQQQQINDIKTELSALKEEIKTVRQELKGEIITVKQEIITLFYWGFGILITMMLFTFGFIIWDRRTFAEPLRERTQSLIQSLREYAKEHPKLADILRAHGLM